MSEKKWTDLERSAFCANHYVFKIATPSIFTQCAFNDKEETLVAVDANGIAYQINLTSRPAYQKVGFVGICSSLAINPRNRNELIAGLNSFDVKVLKINRCKDSCQHSGHTSPPINISFFEEFCLTTSSKEVFIWQLKSFFKIQQLHLNVKDAVIKKAVFSSLGHIAVLYQNDVIQSWMFVKLREEYKLNINTYGQKNVKDFEFTKDARALIVCGLQDNLLIFNTSTWDLLKRFTIHNNLSGIKQLAIVSVPLDGGANSNLAILTSDCKVKFLNVNEEKFLTTCCDFQESYKRIVTSSKGRYLACIGKNSSVEITLLDKMLKIKSSAPLLKFKDNKKIQVQKIKDNLKCIREMYREELDINRLRQILKEYGEYPEKHRALIWSTITDLPNNRSAYISLSKKISTEKNELPKDWLELNGGKTSLLSSVMHCLIAWCPHLKQCVFIQKLLPPFVMVFSKNPVSGFEMSLFILMNFCQRWFEYHPLPPLNILGMVENMILCTDPTLFNVFCKRGVSSSDYIWPLLQTAMSDVLSSNDWLIMWDHILTSQKPWFLLSFVAAFILNCREIFLSKLHTADDIQQFYKVQGHVSIKKILKITEMLDSEIPLKMHPRRYLQMELNFLPKTGPYIPFLENEFPKFVMDEIRIAHLKKLKDKEDLLREYRLKKLQVVEEKRMRMEGDNFLKQIHDMRLDEIQRSYLEQLCNEEKIQKCKIAELEEFDRFSVPESRRDNSACGRSKISLSKSDYGGRKNKIRHKDFQRLQDQIERLEFEVHNLLDTLKGETPKSTSNVKCLCII